MNRKIILLILLLSFSFSSGLFALEVKSSPCSIEIEVLVENENSENEKDEQKLFFERASVLPKLTLNVGLFTTLFLDDSSYIKVPQRPPIS